MKNNELILLAGNTEAIIKFILRSALIYFLILLPASASGEEIAQAWQAGTDSHEEYGFNDVRPDARDSIVGSSYGAKNKQPLSIWREIRGRELSFLFTLVASAYLCKAVLRRIKRQFSGRVKSCKTWSEANRAWYRQNVGRQKGK